MSAAPVIAGRDTELATLDAFVANIHERASILALEGDIGSGKTTLWMYGLEAASHSGATILVANPSEAETGFAYAGLADLLSPVLDRLHDLSPPLRRALEHAFLIREPEADGADERAIALATLALTRELASERPVLIAVDDLHWLDRASLRALLFAVRRLREERVGVLFATRDGAAIRRELPPGHDVLRVGPLSLGAIGRIVRERLSEDISRPMLHRIYSAAAGNPFYALELAAAVRHDHPLDLTIPPSLQQLVRDRVDRLPNSCLDVCLTVGLAAEPTEALVEAVLGAKAVAELERAAALDFLDLSGERLRFRHPLLGSVIAGRASRRRIEELHRKLATVVDDAEQRACHLAAASTVPDADVAAIVDEGGQRAALRGAPSAAADLLEEAVRLTPSELRDAAAMRTTVAAEYRFLAGETERAEELLNELAVATPPGAARARISRPLARVVAFRGSWAEAATLLRRALTDAGTDVAVAASIHNDLALALMQYGDLAEATRHAEAAVAGAERTGDDVLLADARLNLITIEFQRGRGDPSETVAAFARLRDRRERETELLLNRQLFFITWAKYTDRFEEARTAIRELIEELAARGRYGLLSPVHFQGAELECWAGDLDAAAKFVRAEQTSQGEAKQAAMETRALYVEGLVEATRGNHESARESGLRGLRLAEVVGDRRLVIRHLSMLGLTELTNDDPAAAHAFLARADEMARDAGYGEPGIFRKDGDLIESMIRLGHLDQAEQRIAELEEVGRRLGRTWALATAARCQAQLALARGRADVAAALLERGLLDHCATSPIERGRTLLALGEAQRRARRRRDARETLQQAVTIFDELGVSGWGERARIELARIGGRVGAGDELTPSERRIAELVAEGKTNKEVAAILVVTDRTVESALTQIYRKLGVRSRTELARKLPAAR